MVEFQRKGRRHYVGIFDDLDDAVAARNAAVESLDSRISAR
jgi:hypothetical protein